MKKFLTIFLTLAISLFLLVGCGATPNSSGGGETNDEQNAPTEELPDGENAENNSEEQLPEGDDVQKEITTMYITINGNKLEVTLAKNSSVDALIEILQQGDIIYTADDYGGFEKVGNLGHTLPTNHVQTLTAPGDIVFYQTNQIVMFYGSNSWSYTRIGKLNYSSQTELESFLGAGQGSVQVTISLK